MKKDNNIKSVIGKMIKVAGYLLTIITVVIIIKQCLKLDIVRLFRGNDYSFLLFLFFMLLLYVISFIFGMLGQYFILDYFQTGQIKLL